ncbi:MAG: transcription termination factor NusA [Gemmatimonadota bacterium]|nr:transcription termination factor NusA [Gemmatimonadota bacterium]
MSDQIPVVEAFRMMAANKSLSEIELHDLIREGIHAALARRFGGPVDAEIEFDEVGDIAITVLKEVVEDVEDAARQVTLEQARWDDPDFQVGDLMEIPVSFRDFGRSAVMAAKQRIIQRVREGERERIREEFNDRVGDLVSGEIQAIERGKLVVMLNRSREAEAIIPWREQNPRERFRQGDPIRAVLKVLEETPRGPRLILSRADPQFVASLFALEVPEIYQGIVEIKEIVREAGGRTKVAVSSRDESVDPVGACVGLKGSRVQAVVSELSGERIDIVPWHPDPEVFARRALAPARVAKVITAQDTHVITAIVDDDQLSLAIGRNGQNVRLASQLIGWQIDLYSSRDWTERGNQSGLFGGDEEYEMADFPLSELEGIAPATLTALEAAGISMFYGVLDMDRNDFMQVPGIGEEEADKLESLIDELTVVEEVSEGATTEGETEAEATEGAEAESEADVATAETEPDDAVEENADSGDAPDEEAVAAAPADVADADESAAEQEVEEAPEPEAETA